MSKIFNLTKIRKLIIDAKPSAAIIVDTNIVVLEPDFSFWKTSLENPLWILPAQINFELEHLKNIPDIRYEAVVATRNIKALCHEGKMDEGIYKEGQGWFISMEQPRQSGLNEELGKLDTLVKVFGQGDTALIILAKELMRTHPNLPVIFLTADEKLSNAVGFIGVHSYLFTVFPVVGLEDFTAENEKLMINWDNVLKEIQQEARQNLVTVDLTLESKSLVPKKSVQGLMYPTRHNETQVILARGSGILIGSESFSFKWSLPYIAWDFPDIELLKKPDEAIKYQETLKSPASGLGHVNLDFGSSVSEINPHTLRALEEKMYNCASPMAYVEDTPTLQDPTSVMKQFFLLELAFQENGFLQSLALGPLAEFESRLRDPRNLLNWAVFWLNQRKASPEEMEISMNEFLLAVKNCWNVGETVTVTLMPDKPR